MMAHKHLHELLKEEQEPFLLKNYIADRRSLFNKPIPKNRGVAERSNSMSSLCNQACFFSLIGSPDVGKSPFADFPAASSSPCKPPNVALLHEAIMRIQKQSCASKPETRIKSVGSGLFRTIDSILKRLGGKNRSRRREIGGKWEKVRENSEGVSGKSAFEMGFACDCRNSRRNSTVWSERSDEMFLELETSCSSFKSEDSEERESAAEERENGGLGFCEKHFCTSPYRLALEKSPSVGRRAANFSSPATSPSRSDKEEICEVQKIHVEEEKEQSSPVSVLDPPFEDDEEDVHVVGNDEDGFDLGCSYAILERAKQQLLHKLRRFEKLAELDPVELEKRMLEEQENEGGNEEVEDCENDSDRFVREVLSKSGFHFRKVPVDVKRLALDLIAEEERGVSGNDEREAVAKRVCKRLESWRKVKSNTIDMMVELDGWKRNDKELVGETTGEIELAIFGLLVEELSELC